MPDRPTATVVIPTRSRASYLDIALASIVPQVSASGGEIVVVSDGPDVPTEAVTWRHRVRRMEIPGDSGPNAARNAGIAAAQSELIVFVDDDVEVLDGWLQAILDAALGNPEYGVFGGPIIPRLEGGGPRSCGREPPPITELDCGPEDREVPFVWSANMAIRASALRATGNFDPSIRGGRGDEEEWLLRYKEGGGRVRYVARARLLHRRNSHDAKLVRLAAAHYHLGQAARRMDLLKGPAPSLPGELRVLIGSIWHFAARRCGYGLVFAAHAAGRLRQLAQERAG